MSDKKPSSGKKPPSGVELLWARQGAERRPRLGLSLERIVQSGVELADTDGLAAVSMKRVAERLGFTTMSLYRYVTSKDDLLLLMQDAAWQPPEGIVVPVGGWRAGLTWWTQEQFAILEQHPWLDEVRLVERVGMPSQIVWMDLGLRALAEVPLSEYEKTAILLVFSGYAGTQWRLALAAREGAKLGEFAPNQVTEVFGAFLETVVDAERFPALRRAIEGGAFAPIDAEVFASLDFGLDLMLDGVERLIERRVAE